MKNKKIIFVIGVIVAAIFLWQQLKLTKYALYQDYSYTTTPQAEKIEQSTIAVSQKISGRKQQTEQQSLSIESGKTALDLLQQTEKVTMNGKGINAFVEGINYEQSSMKEKTFWAFYANGKQAEVGAGSYMLKDGDAIEWKLETY